MKTLRFILLIVTASFILAGCSKKNEPVPYTYSKIFSGDTKKSWKLTRLAYKEQGKADVNYSASDLDQILGTCVTDNLYTFYANPEKTFQITEGATKCNATDPDVYLSDTWSFNNATASLSMVFPVLSSSKTPYIVLDASSTEMNTEIFVDANNTISYTIHFAAVNE
jgi:hypothetical protein